jgi:hypothetical protein
MRNRTHEKFQTLTWMVGVPAALCHLANDTSPQSYRRDTSPQALSALSGLPERPCEIHSCLTMGFRDHRSHHRCNDLYACYLATCISECHPLKFPWLGWVGGVRDGSNILSKPAINVRVDFSDASRGVDGDAGCLIF